jgi:hypothetical protein
LEVISPHYRECYSNLSGIAVFRNHALTTPAIPVLNEYERYTKEPAVVGCTDPINWWIIISLECYPWLVQMALNILSIPPMSDELERIFSQLGLMITDYQNHLKSDTI